MTVEKVTVVIVTVVIVTSYNDGSNVNCSKSDFSNNGSSAGVRYVLQSCKILELIVTVVTVAVVEMTWGSRRSSQKWFLLILSSSRYQKPKRKRAKLAAAKELIGSPEILPPTDSAAAAVTVRHNSGFKCRCHSDIFQSYECGKNRVRLDPNKIVNANSRQNSRKLI